MAYQLGKHGPDPGHGAAITIAALCRVAYAESRSQQPDWKVHPFPQILHTDLGVPLPEPLLEYEPFRYE